MKQVAVLAMLVALLLAPHSASPRTSEGASSAPNWPYRAVVSNVVKESATGPVRVWSQDCPAATCPVLLNTGGRPIDVGAATVLLTGEIYLAAGQTLVLSGKAEYVQSPEIRALWGVAATTMVVHVIKIMLPGGSQAFLRGSLSGTNITYADHYTVLPIHGVYTATDSGTYRLELLGYSATSKDPTGTVPLVRVKGKIGPDAAGHDLGSFTQMAAILY